MENVKDIAKWLKDEVEFLRENEDYNGGWLELDNGLGICVYWADGFGDEARDDVIQSKEQSDWALVVGIKLIEPNDISAGGPYYWNFPVYENGEVATEDSSISPDADYDKLAQYLLDDYISVKDFDIDENGVIISEKEEKEIKENLNSNPYKKIILEYFEYDGDFDFLELVSNIIDRIDNYSDEDDIYQAIDDGLIYYSDQWKVLQHYCNPQDANWDEALDYFMSDIYAIASEIAKSKSEEEED